jgi:hypothetical protein
LFVENYQKTGLKIYIAREKKRLKSKKSSCSEYDVKKIKVYGCDNIYNEGKTAYSHLFGDVMPYISNIRNGHKMNNQITFKQYRNIDIGILCLLTAVFEVIATLATSKWFAGQPMAISITLALILIAMHRWSAFAGLVAVVGGAAFCFATGPDAPTLATALFCSGVSFAISKVSDGVCGVLRGALRQELTGGTVFVFRILFGVVNFAILFFGGRVVALVVGNAVLTLLQLMVYVALLRAAVPRFRFSLRSFRRGRVRELFEYGVFAFLAQVGETAVDRSDLLLISAFMTLNDVARYNLVVVTLCSYLTSFIRETSTWQTNWFAKLAAPTLESEKNDATSLNDGEERKRCENDGCGVALSAEFFASRAAIHRASIAWTLFLAGGVLAFGRAFVERWIGAAYLDVFPALVLCVAATALYRGSSETNARALQGVARHRVLAVGAILHGAANVLLSVLFIRCGLGLYGVALGTVLPGVAIHFGWTPNAACRLLGERRRTYWARYLKAMAVSVAALAFPFATVWRCVKPDYCSICAWGVFYVGVGASALFVLATTDEEKRALVRRLRKRRDAASMDGGENLARKDVA